MPIQLDPSDILQKYEHKPSSQYDTKTFTELATKLVLKPNRIHVYSEINSHQQFDNISIRLFRNSNRLYIVRMYKTVKYYRFKTPRTKTAKLLTRNLNIIYLSTKFPLHSFTLKGQGKVPQLTSWVSKQRKELIHQ